MFVVGARVRIAFMNLIYRKVSFLFQFLIILIIYNLQSLKLSPASLKSSSVGQMVNLIAVDCNTLFMLTTFLNIIWSGPFQIIVSIFMLWRYIGVASLAGLATMLVFIPFNIGLGTISKNLRKKKLVLTDSRIKATNDMLNGIKVF